jgi:hypothetical protein
VDAIQSCQHAPNNVHTDATVAMPDALLLTLTDGIISAQAMTNGEILHLK